MMHTSPTNRAVVWFLVIVAALANAAGYVFNLFSKIGWYDDVLHFYTSFALLLAIALLLYGRTLTGLRDGAFLFVLIVMLIGVGIGGLWEIGEFGYDHLISSTNSIQGKTDTISDMVLDAVGALLAGIVAAGMANP